MAKLPPLPGHLSNEETERLLEPLADFALAVRDLTSLIHVWSYDERRVDGATLRSFTLGRSSGSGGTAVTGSTSIEVAVVEDPTLQLCHLHLRRRGFANRLRVLFSSERVVGGGDLPLLDADWLACSRSPGEARALLRRIAQAWNDFAADSRLEGELHGPFVALHAPEQAVTHEVLRETALALAAACR